jgi:hypothetical protein
MVEDKRERFKRLASARTSEVLKKLRVLSNCSNKSAYSYTPDEVEKIFNTIEKATSRAKAAFKTSKSKEDIFKL